MSPFLILLLFYLVNHEPAESKWAIKRDAFENMKKQKTNIGNEERTNNDIKKGFINLMNSDDTASVEVEVTEKIRTRHFKTEFHDDDPFMSSGDIDSEESLEFYPKKHKITKTDKSKDYKIETKNIIKTSNAREVYEITVNNINKTIRYIYNRDQRNTRMEVVTPRRVIKQSLLQKFLTRMYNSCLKNFYILRDKTEDPVLKIIIDSGIEYYKKEYKDHMKEYMKIANNNNHLDQVISVLESINLGQNVMDNLFAIILFRSNNTNSTLRIENVVRNSFDKLFDAQNEYICKELGVCRSATTFKNSFIGFIDIMLKGDDDKLYAAISALLKAFGESVPRVYQIYQSMISQAGGKQLATQYARNFFMDVKQQIKDGKYLILDKVPATPANVALWNKISSEAQAFMNDEIKDLTPTVTALKNFVKPYMKQIHNRKKSGNVYI